MDIEAIRKRNAERLEIMLTDDLHNGNQAAFDCDDLLGYISALEEKLRWKKVAEEKPPLNKDLLLRGTFTELKAIRIHEDSLKNLWYWFDDVKKIC